MHRPAVVLVAAFAFPGTAVADANGIRATYDCEEGLTLVVRFRQDPYEAVVDLPDGSVVTLPGAPSGSGFHYTNGRYGLRGKGRDAMWEIGRRAPIDCLARDE